MTEQNETPTPEQTPEPLPVANFDELEAQFPAIAQQLREALALGPAVVAERELGAQQGETKKLRALGLADEQIAAIANGVYDAVDLVAGFPGPVDALMHTVVAPVLPQLIDQAAEFLHRIGAFQRVF